MEDERIQRMRDYYASVNVPVGPIRQFVQQRIEQLVVRGPDDPNVREFLETALDGTKRLIMIGAALEVEVEHPDEEEQKRRKKNVSGFFEKFTPEQLGFKTQQQMDEYNNMTSLYGRESVEVLDDDENIEPSEEEEESEEEESEEEGSGMFRIGWKP